LVIQQTREDLQNFMVIAKEIRGDGMYAFEQVEGLLALSLTFV